MKSDSNVSCHVEGFGSNEKVLFSVSFDRNKIPQKISVMFSEEANSRGQVSCVWDRNGHFCMMSLQLFHLATLCLLPNVSHEKLIQGIQRALRLYSVFAVVSHIHKIFHKLMLNGLLVLRALVMSLTIYCR